MSTGETLSNAPLAPAVARGTLNSAYMRAPDFFVIGHQKCGTTALYEMLREHPQVFLSEHKEPRFFAPELRPPLDRETPDRPQTLERYLALFADARPGELIGDTSPQYIRSPTAAARIAELSPDARIVAIVREPASYLRSYHMQMVQSHVEPEKDFRKAVGLERERREQASADGSFLPPQFLYSEHVRYVEQLRRFEAHFPRERMMLIVYDDFRADNEGTVRALQRFLGIDDTLPIRPVQSNPMKTVRSVRLHRLRNAVGRADADPASAGALARTLTSLASKRVRRGALGGAVRRLAYAAPEPPDEGFARELRRLYKPEVVALGEYLGRDLVSLWGYDEID
jgi:Sulfotransferase family